MNMMMNILALFRCDKPVGMMSGKEGGQGITVDKATKIVRF